MRPARILTALAFLLLPTLAHAQHGCARLSWGTCDPWVENQNFAGPESYRLVCSFFGTPDLNLGTDCQIRLREFGSSGYVSTAADCWRFDDSGCQGSNRVSVSIDSTQPSCPSFSGSNPVVLSHYDRDLNGDPILRISVSYGSFSPAPSMRYTVWEVAFDQSHSTIGPTPLDQSSCGGAERCENIAFDYASLLTPTAWIVLPDCDHDVFQAYAHVIAEWNGGCLIPDPVQRSTWGRMKGLYR